MVARGGGYALRRSRQLDADRFERLVAEGQAALAAGRRRGGRAVPGGAGVVARPGAADLAGVEPLAREAARLEELRLAAIVDRIDADLALGRHGGAPGSWSGWSASIRCGSGCGSC